MEYLHFPRRFSPRHFAWDLDRGFRLEVLGPGVFWLSLLDREGCAEPSVAVRQGEEQDFLLAMQPDVWPVWPPERLSPHTVCVLLDKIGSQRPIDVPPNWPNLVIKVLQSLADGTRWSGNHFFTPEQVLQQWGRVGRRVRRRSRWRKLIPW